MTQEWEQQRKLFSYASDAHSPLKRNLIRFIEQHSGQDDYIRLYHAFQQLPPQNPWQYFLDKLNIQLDLQQRPGPEPAPDKPLVIIANHPFGVPDGLAMGLIASQLRSEFKILTNSALCKLPEFAPYLLPISFDPGREALQINLQTRRAALQTLANNGCVVLFPSGGVATTQRWYNRFAQDLPWKQFVIKLISDSRAQTLPVHFAGQNSALFQVCSHVSSTLRLGLFYRELKRLRHRQLSVTIKPVVAYDDIAHLNKQQLLQHLRDITLAD